MENNCYSKAMENISICCYDYLKNNNSKSDKKLINNNLILLDVLVDKTIPVKAIRYTISQDWYCAKCGENVRRHNESIENKKYCSNCGQKLEWPNETD